MGDPIVPLTERSLQFTGHTFRDMARTRDAETCRSEARKARQSATTSTHPLLCLARAVWWDAVADHADTDNTTAADRPARVQVVEQDAV
ncbi:MAG: hypothetical protein ACRD0P_39785 [Stackebrandtia sp.]